MKPGERVAVIRRIVALLGDWDWSDVDLVLRQFGFPWSREWDGAKRSYLVAHIEETSDEALQQLLAYAENPEASGPATLKSEPAWQRGYFRLFLSHIHDFRSYLGEVKIALARWGIDGFVAHADIAPSHEWEDVIERALGTCDALAAFLHEGFRASQWTDQEVGYSIQRGVLVIPVRFSEEPPHGFMSRYQAVAGAGLTAEVVADSLVRVLVDRENEKMAEALMARFEGALSYVDAIRLVEAMEGWIRRWPPGLLTRLQNAVTSNSNVGGSFKARNVIERIAEKHSATPMMPS